MPLLIVALLLGCLSAMKMDSLELNIDGSSVNAYRLMVAQRNQQLISRHNSDDSKSYKLKAYPQFMALTNQQFNAKYLMPQLKTKTSLSQTFTFKPTKLLGGSQNQPGYLLDLRKELNSTVKNQGACLNSYAYVVADLLDMLNLLAKNNLGQQASPQHLTDCSSSSSISVYERNSGCAGGLLNNSLAFAQKVGIYLLGRYKMSLSAVNNGTSQACKSAAGTRYQIKNWTQLQTNNPNERVNALIKRKTIASSIDISGDFRFYKSGIYQGNSTASLNHAVTIMGFSYKTPWGNYWLVKNSWGSVWGEEGYIRIDMAKNCGLLLQGYVANL